MTTEEKIKKLQDLGKRMNEIQEEAEDHHDKMVKLKDEAAAILKEIEAME